MTPAIWGLALWGVVWATGLAGTVIAFDTRVDVAVLRTVAGWRSDPVTTVMRALHALGSQWTLAIGGWFVVLATTAYKRRRQLFVLVPSLCLVGLIAQGASRLAGAQARIA